MLLNRLFHFLFVISSCSAAYVRGRTPYKTWFSFGDSYTTTGFDVAGPQPNLTAGNPLGNPSPPGREFSESPKWPELVATKYNATVPVLMYNYAIGGATIDNNIVRSGQYWSFALQVDRQFFPNIVDDEAPHYAWTSKDTMASMAFGLNDLWSGFRDVPTYVQYTKQHELLFERMLNITEELFEVGIRNFVFWNMPPATRTPAQMRLSTYENTRQAAQISDWNSRLPQKLLEWRMKHLLDEGMHVWIFDVFTLLNEVVDDYEAYGFENNNISGCNRCMWHDDAHIGGVVQDLVARRLSLLVTPFWRSESNGDAERPFLRAGLEQKVFGRQS